MSPRQADWREHHIGRIPVRVAHEDCLELVVYNTLLEANVLIERWCRKYNTVRPHRSLKYVSPAPVVIHPWPSCSGALCNPMMAELTETQRQTLASSLVAGHCVESIRNSRFSGLEKSSILPNACCDRYPEARQSISSTDHPWGGKK